MKVIFLLVVRLLTWSYQPIKKEKSKDMNFPQNKQLNSEMKVNEKIREDRE